MRHGLRYRPGGAGGQRLQLSVSTPAEPLRDRGRQDALAAAGGTVGTSMLPIAEYQFSLNAPSSAGASGTWSRCRLASDEFPTGVRILRGADIGDAVGDNR
jgi:hypothetical protein